MRTSLRRSCNSCAKAKHRCDLLTPRCSRCSKRNIVCVYANEPLAAQGAPSQRLEPTPQSCPGAMREIPGMNGMMELPSRTAQLFSPGISLLDPFDSYPPTRLGRAHVQRLIHHFLSSIAFQYYPLDLNLTSNPFVASWWPLALQDPALFLVSLQTASLDQELRAQKGFPISEALMVDSITQLRKKVNLTPLAIRDETINTIITLAAIEHGKGNTAYSKMHVDGAKQLIGIRGGINEVMRTSPLTARMVSWVSLLVTCRPQFLTSNGPGCGEGIAPIPQWRLITDEIDRSVPELDGLQVDPDIFDTFTRLRAIAHGRQLTNTELHDLTCFVVHRLLSLPLTPSHLVQQAVISECLRYGMVLFLLAVHGTTYYSHIGLAQSMMTELRKHVQSLMTIRNTPRSLEIWLLSAGMATAHNTAHHEWLFQKAQLYSKAMNIRNWKEVVVHLERIMWPGDDLGSAFSSSWQEVFNALAMDKADALQ